MGTLKVGSKKMGFTLLEILVAMGLIGILSFSVIFSFKGRHNEPLRRSEAIVKKLMKIGHRSEILNNDLSYLMILKAKPRIVRLKMNEDSIYEMLHEGVKLTMVNCKEMILENEVWEYDCLEGRKFLSLLADDTQLYIDERK